TDRSLCRRSDRQYLCGIVLPDRGCSHFLCRRSDIPAGNQQRDDLEGSGTPAGARSYPKSFHSCKQVAGRVTVNTPLRCTSAASTRVQFPTPQSNVASRGVSPASRKGTQACSVSGLSTTRPLSCDS